MRMRLRAGRPPGRVGCSPPSPRVRLAVKLYESGVVPTKGRAADVVGLSRSRFYVQYRRGHKDIGLVQEAQRMKTMIEEKIVDVSKFLDETSIDAVRELRVMMKNAAISEVVRLKAAIDLADRGSKTSKIQRIQASSYSMDGKDVKELALALVAAREARLGNDEGIEGDVVKVVDVKEPMPVLTDGLRRTA